MVACENIEKTLEDDLTQICSNRLMNSLNILKLGKIFLGVMLITLELLE